MTRKAFAVPEPIKIYENEQHRGVGAHPSDQAIYVIKDRVHYLAGVEDICDRDDDNYKRQGRSDRAHALAETRKQSLAAYARQRRRDYTSDGEKHGDTAHTQDSAEA